MQLAAGLVMQGRPGCDREAEPSVSSSSTGSRRAALTRHSSAAPVAAAAANPPSCRTRGRRSAASLAPGFRACGPTLFRCCLPADGARQRGDLRVLAILADCHQPHLRECRVLAVADGRPERCGVRTSSVNPSVAISRPAGQLPATGTANRSDSNARSPGTSLQSRATSGGSGHGPGLVSR